jgi:hypothetical protein
VCPAVQAWTVKTPDGEISGSSEFAVMSVQGEKRWAFSDDTNAVNLNGQAVGAE